MSGKDRKIDRKSLLKAGMAAEEKAVERRFSEPPKDRWAAAEAAMSERPEGLAVGRQDHPAPPAAEAGQETLSARKARRPAGDEAPLSIPLQKAHENPWNARRIYEPEKIAALAASIEAKGQIYPAPACPHPDVEGAWILIDGHYRKRALEQIGSAEILILPRRGMPPREMFRLSYALNEERSEQTALDNALAWNSLLEEGIYSSADELAGSVGLSPAKIAKVMALLKLPAPALELMKESPGKFGPGIGYELYLCSQRIDLDKLMDLARRIISEDLSMRELESIRKGLEHPSQRRRKEVSRQYRIRSGEIQIGTIKEWDSGRVALDVVVGDPSERAALVEELRKRFGIDQASRP